MSHIYFSLIYLIEYVAESGQFVKIEFQANLTEKEISDLNNLLRKRCEILSSSHSLIQFGEHLEIYLFPPGK